MLISLTASHAKAELKMKADLRVFMITSEWPTSNWPNDAPFIVRQVSFLRKHGIQVDVFGFRGAKKPINYLCAWYQVQRRLSKESYDLVHAQWGQSAFPALPKRLPLVITFRGDDLLGIPGDDGRYTLAGKVLQIFSQIAARFADRVIVVSDPMKRYLHPSVHVSVIPSGVDLTLFRRTAKEDARNMLRLAPNRHLVAFVGDPSEATKRYFLAQQAVELLSNSMEVELLVVWEKPHTSIPLYMSACDALLLTSINEGSPNVVKEALACDLPIVSVNVGDVLTRLSGIEGCEVCFDDKPSAIAKALEHVLKRGKRIKGRERIQALDEHLLTRKVIEIYQSVSNK